jgi:hypothetical protein
MSNQSKVSVINEMPVIKHCLPAVAVSGGKLRGDFVVGSLQVTLYVPAKVKSCGANAVDLDLGRRSKTSQKL